MTNLSLGEVRMNDGGMLPSWNRGPSTSSGAFLFIFVFSAGLAGSLLGNLYGDTLLTKAGVVRSRHVIEASELRIIDAAGNRRVLIAADQENTRLLLLEPGSKTAVGILTAHNGLGLMLRSEHAEASITLHHKPEFAIKGSGASLRIQDADGRDRTVLGGAETETVSTGEQHRRPESSMTLFDKQGKVIWQIP